jgi:hypothetical protein
MSIYIPQERAIEICITGKAEDMREKEFIRNVVDMLL